MLPWAARRRRSRFPAEAARLAGSTAALIRETEPDFLRLADDLKALYAGAAELGRSTAAQASSLRTILGECNLTGPAGVASVLLDKLQSGLAETGRELNSLVEVCSAIRRLLHLGRRIRPIAVFLRTAGYSFRVESARLEATRRTFGAFSEELATLAARIAELGDEIETRAEAAHAELAQLVQSISTGLNQLREVAARTGPIVRHTCEDTQQLLDSSLNALEQSEARTVRISRHAGDAIYHMQFGDIVRQKLEHIGAALTEASEVLASRDRPADRADRILALQNAQIELVRREIQSVREGLAEAFAGLRTEGAHLAQTVRDLRNGAAGDSSNGAAGDSSNGAAGDSSNGAAGDSCNRAAGDSCRPSPFEELSKHLLQLEEATSRGAGLCGQSRRSWRRAMEASSQVCRCMDQVREINFRMHLQSLNAIIKTEWLGDEGRTLRVLSTHMHAMFRESSELVADTSAVLDAIARPVESGTSAEEDAAGLKSRLASDLDEVGRAQRQLQQTIEAAAGLSRQQQDQLEQAHQSLEFLAVASTRLDTLSAGITGLRHQISPLKSLHENSIAEPAVSELYTMASERQVHHQLLADNPENENLDAAAQPDDGNIEFF
jgi:chromosome segregation ATPase